MIIAKLFDEQNNYVIKFNKKLSCLKYSCDEVNELSNGELLSLLKVLVDNINSNNFMEYYYKTGSKSVLYLEDDMDPKEEDENEEYIDEEIDDEYRVFEIGNFKLIGNKLLFRLLAILSVLCLFLGTECFLNKSLLKVQEDYIATLEEICDSQRETFSFNSDLYSSEINKIEFLTNYIANDMNIDESILYDALLNNKELTSFQKEIILNKQLLCDIVNSCTDSRKVDLLYNLSCLHIVPYTEDEIANSNQIAYVESVDKTTIHASSLEPEDQAYFLEHEYCHVLQALSPYNYLLESVAEITAYEYYGKEIKTYVSCVQRTRALMEIIGPQPIWNCVYGGDSSLLKEQIINILGEEDGKELLNLLMQSPCDVDDITLVDASIDVLLNKMYFNVYGTEIKDDEVISYILNSSRVYRNYFYVEKVKENENGFNVSYLYFLESFSYKCYSILNGEKVEVSLEEAISLKNDKTYVGEIDIEITNSVNGKEIIGFDWGIDENMKYFPYVIAREFVIAPSIMDRFPGQFTSDRNLNK